MAWAASPALDLACVANGTTILECNPKSRLARGHHGATRGGDLHIPGATALRKLVLVLRQRAKRPGHGRLESIHRHESLSK